MRLYFAYGSNMCVQQMQHRCPHAVALGPACLSDWSFIINPRGTAAIRPLPRGHVYGVLWSLTREGVATLDGHEGVSAGRYHHSVVEVSNPQGRWCALTYVPNTWAVGGRAIRCYMEATVLPAARHWRLPAAYLGELAQWLNVAPIGPHRRHLGQRGWAPHGLLRKRSDAHGA